MSNPTAKGYAAVRRIATTEHPLGWTSLAAASALLGIAALLTAVPPTSVAARWLLAGITASVLIFVCLRSTVQGVFATFAWLLLVGLTRRLASEVIADPGRDPFVLVGALAVGVLAVRALLGGCLRHRTILANAMLVFSALVVLEMLNPKQGSGLGRVAGLLVWLVPTLWFWVGRSFSDDRLANRFLVVAGGGTLLAAGYGLAQSVVGFPPWDQRWIDLRGYSSLYIGPGTWHPFGTFASATEFGQACAVAAIISAAAFFSPRLVRATAIPAPETVPADETDETGAANENGENGENDSADQADRSKRARWIAALALAAFLIASLALVQSAVRASLVLLVVALPIVYVIVKGKRAWIVLVPAMILAALAVAALSRVDPNDIADHGASAALHRVVVVVNDPFASTKDNTGNTLESHYDNAKHGFNEAFRTPLGHGTGSTGIVGEHFGGRTTSTDFDITDAGLAFGIAGLLVTLGIFVLAFVTAVGNVRRRRSFERIALLGIMIVSIGAWFQGAHYAMAPLLWLLLGRADTAKAREHGTEPRGGDAAPADPEPSAEIAPSAP